MFAEGFEMKTNKNPRTNKNEIGHLRSLKFSSIMKPNWLGKFLILMKWLMVANNIDAIRHGTLIQAQV